MALFPFYRNSSIWTQSSSSTPVDPLPAPIAYDGFYIGVNIFTVAWSYVSEAEEYRWDVSELEDFSTFVPFQENVKSTSLTAQTSYPLLSNTTYYYRVRAVNSEQTSDNSNVVSVTTVEEIVPPGKVAWKPTEDITTDSFVLNWLTPDGVVDFYFLNIYKDIEMITPLEPYVEAFNIGNVNTYFVDKLKADTSFYCVIFAVNDGGISEISEILTVTTSPDKK